MPAMAALAKAHALPHEGEARSRAKAIALLAPPPTLCLRAVRV